MPLMTSHSRVSAAARLPQISRSKSILITKSLSVASLSTLMWGERASDHSNCYDPCDRLPQLFEASDFSLYDSHSPTIEKRNFGMFTVSIFLSQEALKQLGIDDSTKFDERTVKEQVRNLHPEFTSEDAEAFLAYLSVRQKRSEVFKRLADA